MDFKRKEEEESLLPKEQDGIVWGLEEKEREREIEVRCQWFKGGDLNTTFFHMTSMCKWVNNIIVVETEGQTPMIKI